VLPEAHEHLLVAHHGAQGVDHALPDAGQVPEVENIVELGWRG